MTLEALRVLCAVADTRSFSAAAAAVDKTQPAVSQQVKGLEKEFGQSLIDRRTCLPTPAGRLVLERARKLLIDADNLGRVVSEHSGKADSELRIGASDTMALYFLPSVIEKFTPRMRGTRVHVVCRSTDEILDRVIRRTLDLGLVTMPVRRPELDETPLFDDPIVLLVNAHNPLSKKKSILLRELAAENLLMLDSTTRTGMLIQQWFERESFIPNIVLDSGSFEVLKRYVGANVGVAFLPASAAREGGAAMHAINVKGAPCIGIGAVRLRGAYLTKSQRLFMELLDDQTRPA